MRSEYSKTKALQKVNNRFNAFLIITSILTSALLSIQAYAENGNSNPEIKVGTEIWLLSELVKQAEEKFSFENQDAVILVNEERITLTDDYRKKRYVHKVVWISTSNAVSRYGDHRIPLDAKFQKMDVHLMRTWMDNKWWDTGESGIVETLPFSVSKAPDYSSQRDMILIHNGIEVPCILEWAYTIEDTSIQIINYQGLHHFQGDDPTLLSTLILDYPINRKIRTAASKSVPDAEKTKIPGNLTTGETSPENSTLNRETLFYRMMNIEAAPLPRLADPAIYQPHVVWSTWRNWTDFGSEIRESFDRSLEINQSLKDSLDKFLESTLCLSDKAHHIAKFVNISTRLIHSSNERFFLEPRQAQRTFETGYGTALDRTVLAAALYQYAGFLTFPMFLSSGFEDCTEKVASISRLYNFGVWISGSDEVEAYFNPQSCVLSNGLSPIFARSVWIPGSGDDPKVNWNGEANLSSMTIELNLDLSDDLKEITGKGYYLSEQGFNAFDRMEGLNGEMKDHVESVISSILADTKIISCNPVSFSRFKVAVGFEFKTSLEEKDDSGEISLLFNNPTDGVIDHLPKDIQLYDEIRHSPIRLPGKMEQIIKIRINSDSAHFAYLPAERELTTKFGSFQSTISKSLDKVTITRKLNITKVKGEPEEWSELRELLLTAKNAKYHKVKVVK